MSDNLTNTIGAQQGTEMFAGLEKSPRRAPTGKTIKEAERETQVFAETDVLVVGGGPAGTAAAISAGRVGADVMLVERYNHLGGLSTGGLVIWIDRMTDWNGTQVIAGMAHEFMDRLPKDALLGPSRSDWGSQDTATAEYWTQRSAAYHGIVTWSPTIDPEGLKTLSLTMVQEQKVDLVLHSWATQPIMEDGVVRGAIFESKSGRQAILAKVVVDTTGDADLLSQTATAMETNIDDGDIHHCINTAFLLGGVNMDQWLDFRQSNAQGFKTFMAEGRSKVGSFEKPCVGWRNDIALFMGPRLSGYSATNVDDLTEVELRSRQLTVQHVDFYRTHAPGFGNSFLMLGAPQIGVRHSRRLRGQEQVTRAQWDEGKIWADEIGVSTSLAPKFDNVSIPYGALLPRDVTGILGAGRHISCDASSHSFLREVPQCWLTGQAAGTAAALAANENILPSKLDVRRVQRELLKQGSYLSPSVEHSLIVPDAAE
jgi:hypothetical protein